MKAKSIFSALLLMGAMFVAAPSFAQDCAPAQEPACGCNTPCTPCVVVRKCDVFSGLRCKPVCAPCTPCKPACDPCIPCAPCKPVCKPVCKPACQPCVPCKPVCKPVCKPACQPCAPCKPVCAPCKPVCAPCKPVCDPCGCKPVCKPICVPCCKKFVVKKECCAPCAPACDPAPACTPCAPVCKPCAPAPVCTPCAPACTPCIPCAPCRPLMSLFSQIRCDISIAACNARCGLANIGFGLQTFRCSLAANIAQCKAEADMKEACRVAGMSEKCGELEVCVPNRIRPGATVKGIFRTLFGGPCPCACDAAPACGCNAAPACGCDITEPACAAPAAEPTPADEKKVSEKVEPTPAPAVTEEKAEVEEGDSEIEDSLIPEADPAAVSKNFYNPSHSIVLR